MTDITEDFVDIYMLKLNIQNSKCINFCRTLPQYPLIKKLQLVGEDADSFFTITTDINITLSDVYNNLAQHMDASNYPPSHPMYSISNKAS